MKICLCMIVKDEEKYLKTALTSALKLADTAVVVDTGSNDKTMDILREFGERVEIRHFQWINDFSAARNYSLEGINADWILVMDADQRLICDAKAIREMLANSTAEGYDIVEESHMGGGAKSKTMAYVKLFRNKGYQYHRAVHEQLNINQSAVESLQESICKIIHYGYLEQNMKEKNKAKRNLDILLTELKKNPQDDFLYFHIGATYGAMEEYQRSLEYYFKCLELKQEIGFSNFHFNLIKRIALNYLMLEEFDECRRFIDKILTNKNCEEFVDLFFIKGLCFKAQKRHEEAVQIFSYCLKIGETGDFPTVYGRGSFLAKLELARIYANTGKVNLAASTYEEALQDSHNQYKEGMDEYKNFLSEKGLLCTS
ncbi:glycosyltransferase [Pelosinus propionicus]|uniref:Tetratricopeptide repeat-containing protein n=1 Tax=Pelosinus propionicus DSM 13327 TaxID=1123291 RepID=A0A1I4HUR9_9FIRM|nr:glycosyltransferase family 2 protein [Pelosinus propionicus]SFL45560.1 Tetratricopeptide repeat-containing protein [Pelosinus propionicus DSM 13327]